MTVHPTFCTRRVVVEIGSRARATSLDPPLHLASSLTPTMRQRLVALTPKVHIIYNPSPFVSLLSHHTHPSVFFHVFLIALLGLDSYISRVDIMESGFVLLFLLWSLCLLRLRRVTYYTPNVLASPKVLLQRSPCSFVHCHVVDRPGCHWHD